MSRVYLDHNATAPLRPEARDAMIAAMEVAGNPSSVHAEGRDAKALLERARADLSEALGCKPAEIVFTGGATEAASVLAGLPAGHDVFVQDTAHDALRVHMRLANWQKRPLGPGHTLAMGLANSETGVISEPPEKIDGQYPFGSGARADWLLLDITQAVGRMPFSFSWSEADLAVLSGHKHGGPKGVGALIVRDGLDINPLSTGGGQELGRRSGTENLIGIAGFAAAAKAAQRDLTDGTMEQVAKLRDILELALEDGSPGTIFVGREGPRLPNTSCFISPGWKGETQVMQMDLAGFAVSAGSACSSGKVKSSSVLRAMGYSEADAGAALRVSLGPQTTEDDVLRFSEAWLKAIHRHQARAA